MTDSAIKMEKRPPKRFGAMAIVVNYVLALAPAAAAMILFAYAVELLDAVWTSRWPGSAVPWHLIASLLAVLYATIVFCYFAPYSLSANYYIKWLVSAMNPESPGPGTVCQVKTIPRTHPGFFRAVDNADDIGMLFIDDSGVEFKGDHINLWIPYRNMGSIEMHPADWALWLVGGMIHIKVAGLDDVNEVVFCERQSATVRGSYRLMRELLAEMTERLTA